MNFEQLNILNVVVKTGTISKAAQQIHKTQPAISMAIKRLEQDVGFAIFDRSSYRLALTEKGKIYYQKSQSVLTQLAQLNNLTDSFKQGEETQVNIAVEVSTNLQHSFTKLKQVQAHYPNTILNIEGTSLLYSLRKLTQGKVDLAITPWLDAFDFEGDFHTKVIGEFGFSMCAHKDLFLPFGITQAEHIDLEVLQQLPQIAPIELGYNLPDRYITKFIGSSLTTVNDHQCLIAGIKAKLGWGIMADSWWSDDMNDDFFRFEPDSEQPAIAGQVRLIRNSNSVLGPVAKAIWDSL